MNASEGTTPSAAIVVDQWEIFRLGIEKVLSDLDILVSSSTSRIEDAYFLARSNASDLFIVGRTPNLKPERALEVIKRSKPSHKVVLLLEVADGAEVAGLVSKGADGLLLRSATAVDLRDCIAAVVADDRMIAPALSTVALGRIGPAIGLSTEDASERSGLSPRELEVLAELAGGATYDQIAASLIVTKATVKTHLVHIYDKLEASNRNEAIARALALGLLG